MHVLRRAAIEGGPRGPVRGYAALRGGARRSVGLPEGPVRSLGGRYTGLHILVHAGVPIVESREEEDVLGAVGAAMPIAVRPGRCRWTTGRVLRMLQRLRRREPVVGPNAGQSVHAESRYSAVQVYMLSVFLKRSIFGRLIRKIYRRFCKPGS